MIFKADCIQENNVTAPMSPSTAQKTVEVKIKDTYIILFYIYFLYCQGSTEVNKLLNTSFNAIVSACLRTINS